MDNLAYNDVEAKRQTERIHGVTMMAPSPDIAHIGIAGNIYAIFRNYLRNKRCRTFPDGTEVHLDEDTTLIPDAMIVCNRDLIKRRGIFGAPDLVVEVLSRSTAKYDRGVKKDIYEKYGVREYWIVNPSAKSIEVYHLTNGSFVLDNVYTACSDAEWDDMTEEEREKVQLSLKVSLYDDFLIDVNEVFEDI